MGTQNTVTVFESKGVIEARKLKSKIENAKRVLLDTIIEIGRRYSALGDSDKADFRRELGLGASTARQYALINERYLERVKLLPVDQVDANPLEKSIKFATQIAQCSDEAFQEIVARGAVTLSSSGTRVSAALTALDPIKRQIVAATKSINSAARHINAIRTLMEKDGITSMRGPEVKQLREEFQLLCAELMAADPATVEQAKKVLRGEQ